MSNEQTVADAIDAPPSGEGCVSVLDYADGQAKAFRTGQQNVAAQEAVAPLGFVRLAAIKALREDDEVTGVMVHVDPPTDSAPVFLAPVAAAPVCADCSTPLLYECVGCSATNYPASTPAAQEAVAYIPGALDHSAPPRVWLQIDTDGDNSDRSEQWPGYEVVTWHEEPIGGLEIQYVRADLVAPVAAARAVDALRRIRLRMHFIGMPGESMLDRGDGVWMPDWRYEAQLIEHVLHGRPITAAEKPTDTRKRIEVASTPAAPGIDLRQYRDTLTTLRDYASSSRWQGIVADIDALLALIDASPKGSNTDARDAARYRWLRTDTGISAVPRAWKSDEGAFPVHPLHLEVLDEAIDAAMQATSAEVGE